VNFLTKRESLNALKKNGDYGMNITKRIMGILECPLAALDCQHQAAKLVCLKLDQANIAWSAHLFDGRIVIYTNEETKSFSVCIGYDCVILFSHQTENMFNSFQKDSSKLESWIKEN
jgi:hypothetical protein